MKTLKQGGEIKGCKGSDKLRGYAPRYEQWMADSEILTWLLDWSVKDTYCDDEIQLVIPDKVLKGDAKDFNKKARILLLKQILKNEIEMARVAYWRGMKAHKS